MLPLIYAPNEIFKKKSAPVEKIDDSTHALIAGMFETLYLAHAVGMAANMVGALKRIIIVDLNENNVKNPLTLINPQITWKSSETQTFEEGSICFPGISAPVTRPTAIKVSYMDIEGSNHEMEADGFLATVIQHEIDYLDGIVFLDYLSKLKRDMLIKKMIKHSKMYPPHIHTSSCNH